MRIFKSYAKPSTWGQWTKVGEHTGQLSFSLTAKPEGDTIIRCQIKYWKKTNQQVEEEWRDEITITTANVYGSVEVRFMGLPLGSNVEGTINP